MSDDTLEPLLTEKQLSAWLGISLPNLQRMRSRGGGPLYIQLSERRIGYRKSAVETWLASRTIARVGEFSGAAVVDGIPATSWNLQMTPPAQRSNLSATLHDKDMAAKFLAILDPSAREFTLQFLGDGTQGYTKVFHGSLDDGGSLKTITLKVSPSANTRANSLG